MIKNKDIPGYVKSIGTDFFKYVLDIDSDQVDMLFNKEIELGEKKEELFRHICSEIKKIRKQNFEANDVNFNLYRLLRETLIDRKHHIMTIWRSDVAEVRVPPVVKDKLLSKILIVAQEFYPSLLIEDPIFKSNLITSHICYQHYLNDDIKKGFIESNELKHVFNDLGIDKNSESIYVMTSAGNGGSIQISVLLNLILTNASYYMRLTRSNTIDDYYESVIQVYQMFMGCLINGVVKVPFFVGFTNIILDEISSLELEDCKLIPYSEEIKSVLPSEVKPGNASGSGYSSTNGFILTGSINYYVSFYKESKGDFPKLKETRSTIERYIEQVKLSIALSQEREEPVSIVRKWDIVFSPFSHGSGVSYNPNRITPTSIYRIFKEEHYDALIEWYKVVKDVDYSKIKIAINRTVNAISERQDPIDGFLDAIIAIENIFGTNSELSFRISMATAFLLHDTYKERVEMQTKVNKLYNDRSKYVHGSKLLTWDEAKQRRDDAIEILILCLRKLLSEQKYLKYKNDQRAKEIILNG